jgi:hypothetical protein
MVMSDKDKFKSEINGLIPAPLKAKFKELFKKFNLPIQPPAPPAAPAAAPASPAQLQESTLADGTVVKYDSLNPGANIVCVTPEGEMPCPEGEHTLQDGTVIKVVNKEGKSVIESVTPSAAPAAAPAAQAAAPDPSAQIAEIKQILQSFTSQKDEVKTLRETVEAQNKLIEDQRKEVHQFMELFDQVLDLPTAEPVEPPKNRVKKDTPLQRIINSKQ